jgi:senataxin
MINNFGNERILACAPTNVGTANLYTRIVDHCSDASLMMPASRIPTGTPILCQSPHARVVCSTISGRAGHVLDSEDFGVVIVDEAAQCMEAWLWCLLRPNVHTIIMAGDTHQLPALTSNEGEERLHNRSLMDRLMSSGYDAEFLNVQHRMHPDIVAFPNMRFYDGRLETNYTPHPTFKGRPYEIINVNGECLSVGTSFLNNAEIERCVEIQTQLAQHMETVVIISPYQAQTRALLAAGARNVHTIDSFQGNEADAVIVSVVREEDIGFWCDYRRLNVALTRARHCLRLVGASKKWKGLLAEMTKNAKQRKLHVV